MKYLLFLFLLISSVASGQVYDSAGYVKVKVKTVYKTDTVVITKPPIVITDTIRITIHDTLYKCPDTIPIPPPSSGYIETFKSGYDRVSDITYGGNGQYGKEPASSHLSTTTYKTGPGSFYSIPADVSNGTRSEVQYTEAAQNPTEGAVEWDVMYEVIIPNNGCSIQWHPNTSGSSGSPYLMHDGGKFTWVVWKSGGNTYYPTNFTIQTQRWYRMRVEYKFSGNGYWKHWIDGVLVVSWNGNVGDGSGQYLKVGYNGWDANSAKSRIYYDNLKIYKKQ